MTHEFEMIEVRREIAANPQTVWRCWTDPALKKAWFVDDNGPEWSTSEYRGDLGENGEESAVFRHAKLGSFTIRSRVLVAEAPRRLIYAYRMDSGATPITASLVTLAFAASGAGTALALTEQINFIDGGDSMETRVPGTEAVVDKMVRAAERISSKGEI